MACVGQRYSLDNGIYIVRQICDGHYKLGHFKTAFMTSANHCQQVVEEKPFEIKT